MPNKHSSSSKKNKTVSSQPDHERSINEWGKLTVNSLRTKLNELQLPEEGKKLELQERLYNHFHPPANESTKIQLSAILQKFKTLHSEVNSLKKSNNIPSQQSSNVEAPVGDQHINFVSQHCRDSTTLKDFAGQMCQDKLGTDSITICIKAIATPQQHSADW